MKRLQFWLEKFRFMITFACWREWTLVNEEWKVTYAEMMEAEANSYKIYREAALRLLEGIEGSTETEREMLARLREETE